MPSHQARREPLPKGYQFGQGAICAEIAQRRMDCTHRVYMDDHDGVWCMNCGMPRGGWNVIEGEAHE